MTKHAVDSSAPISRSDWGRVLWILAMVALVALPSLAGDWPAARDPRLHATDFPDWAFSMRIWPFDILTPTMSDGEIEERLDEAQNQDAQVVIVYLEEEHMYGSFVDESGFQTILGRIGHLTQSALGRGLRTLVYVNGLEVMTRGAFDASCRATGVDTMASEHPDWLQRDLAGDPIVYRCQDQDWLRPDWEDAWMSPYSGYKDFFRQRIVSLAGAGVDGVYIDAVFLPGYQTDEENRRWGSTDSGFATEFTARTGYALPADDDLTSSAFRAFLSFRHEAVADYLADLAQTAWDNGLVPFWESSTNDTAEGTLLGNATAVTGRSGLGFSPEVEPEGDWFAAFRMAKAARELNQERPSIYLAWPETGPEANLHTAIALAHSGTQYPTADSPLVAGAWSWMAGHGELLARRVPYGGEVALVYSVRNQDFTLETEAFFDSYVEAFETLVDRHVPFRIATLEYLSEDGLAGVSTVVLPGLEAISDGEAALLASRTVVPLGAGIGTRDENWDLRDQPLTFSDTIDLDAVEPSLPFGIEAPEGSWIELYGDRDGKRSMTLFVVSPSPMGEIRLMATGGSDLSVTTSRLGEPDTLASGAEVSIAIDAPLLVLQVTEEGGVATPCLADSTTLCIDGKVAGDARFQVEVDYDTALGGGRSGAGQAIRLGSLGIDRGGLFWFFNQTNPEMLIKVLDGCGVNGKFWVFYSAGTNVGLEIRVTDTATGRVWTDVNPDNHQALPVADTSAFVCEGIPP